MPAIGKIGFDSYEYLAFKCESYSRVVKLKHEAVFLDFAETWAWEPSVSPPKLINFCKRKCLLCCSCCCLK